MNIVIVIAGPTASGKTSLGVSLARSIGGEVISADSMQVYKYLDIGTAKPTSTEMQGVRHHMIDEVTPDEEFNVVRFQATALRYIQEIIQRGSIPIIVGGTGLYISSLVNNIQYADTSGDGSYREYLKMIAEKKGKLFLHEELRRIDIEAASRIHSNDIRRVIRALEVYGQTGKNMSGHIAVSRQVPSEYAFIMIGLAMDRQRLYDRIDRRVDGMFAKGLVDEVCRVVRMGYSNCLPVMQGLGYKEIIWYLDGEATLDETRELLKRNTRRFAKRQMTWFRRMDDIKWFDAEGAESPEILKNVHNHIETCGVIL